MVFVNDGSKVVQHLLITCQHVCVGSPRNLLSVKSFPRSLHCLDKVLSLFFNSWVFSKSLMRIKSQIRRSTAFTFPHPLFFTFAFLELLNISNNRPQPCLHSSHCHGDLGKCCFSASLGSGSGRNTMIDWCPSLKMPNIKSFSRSVLMLQLEPLYAPPGRLIQPKFALN